MRPRRPTEQPIRPGWLAVLALALCLQGGLTIPASEAAESGDPFKTLKMARFSDGLQATPFELRALDGRVVGIASLKGKVVLANFWATWCGPCKEEMPSLARLQSQLDPERFVLVTITTDLQPQGIRQFLSQLGVSLPVLFDEDQEVSRGFMVRGLPTTILIGADGKLVGRAVGPRTWDSPEAVASMRRFIGMTP